MQHPMESQEAILHLGYLEKIHKNHVLNRNKFRVAATWVGIMVEDMDGK